MDSTRVAFIQKIRLASIRATVYRKLSWNKSFAWKYNGKRTHAYKLPCKPHMYHIVIEIQAVQLTWNCDFRSAAEVPETKGVLCPDTPFIFFTIGEVFDPEHCSKRVSHNLRDGAVGECVAIHR